MEIDNCKATIEALLFASGEPVSISKICETLALDESTAQSMIKLLEDELYRRNSGLCIVKLENSYQLTTRKEYAPAIRKLLDMRNNMPLSSAAFEVLAVIAYNQPVTKAFIEQVRGVDCSGVVSSLVEKSLIEEKGRLELPGRPLLYGTTKDFLRCFGMTLLNELPPLPDKNESDGQNISSRELEEVTAVDAE